jgi:hypothetical protein
MKEIVIAKTIGELFHHWKQQLSYGTPGAQVWDQVLSDIFPEPERADEDFETFEICGWTHHTASGFQVTPEMATAARLILKRRTEHEQREDDRPRQHHAGAKGVARR